MFPFTPSSGESVSFLTSPGEIEHKNTHERVMRREKENIILVKREERKKEKER